MALTEPNVPAFRSRFPEFETLKDADIQAILDDATDELDADAWAGKKDYVRAILLLAAHYLALRQQALASGKVSRGVNSIDTFVRSVGFGERRVMFGERTLGRSAGFKYGPGEAMFEQTFYGQRLLQVIYRNFPPFLLLNDNTYSEI